MNWITTANLHRLCLDSGNSVSIHTVRRFCDKHLSHLVCRLGLYRAFKASDLPEIEEVMAREGLLKREAAAA
jgi:hypothetical protein